MLYIYIFLIAGVGFAIALYTYLTEKKVQINPNFKPFCDISDRISCTKPMKSKYAHFLFFSNSLLAMAFYLCIMLLSALNIYFHYQHIYPNTMPFIHLLLMIIIALGSIYSVFLAYILYVKLKTLCLLCTSMYVINAILLYLIFAYNINYLYSLS